LHKKASFLKAGTIILYMEGPLFGIAYDPKTNKKKLTILEKADKEGFYMHSIDIEKLKENIDGFFDQDFKSIKKAYLKDELIQKINIPLDEFYKIVKTDLAIALINKFAFDEVRAIYIPDSEGLYLIYKEIFDGNLDLETFRKVLLEMLIQSYYRSIINETLYIFEKISKGISLE
jgi:hypothetical protein